MNNTTSNLARLQKGEHSLQEVAEMAGAVKKCPRCKSVITDEAGLEFLEHVGICPACDHVEYGVWEMYQDEVARYRLREEGEI